MARKHCSDEQLLQYLDGELPLLSKWRVPSHLRRCWRCRTRLGVIESQVHSLMRRIDDQPFPLECIASARSRFLCAAAAMDADQWRTVPLTLRIPRPRLLAGIAVSLSAFAWWHFVPARSVAPAVIRYSKAATPVIRARPSSPIVSAATVPIPVAKPLRAAVVKQEKLEPLPNLDDLEVRILSALHQHKACLGEEIRLVRTDPRHIDLTGIVESESQRETLAAVISPLSPDGAVRLNVRSVAELPVAELPPAVLTSPPAEPSSADGRIPLESGLLRGFSALHPDESQTALENRVLALSNDVLRLATMALEHAWAIRNLAERYPVSRFDHLPPGLAALVRDMVRDHAASLHHACSELSGQLNPPLNALRLGDPDSQELQPLNSWQAAAATLLPQVQQLHRDAHHLFSLTGTKIEDPLARARRLQASLSMISREASAFH